MYKKGYGLKGWILIIIIWLLSIYFDHIWLTFDQGLPAWDQAEFLTNAAAAILILLAITFTLTGIAVYYRNKWQQKIG